MIRPNFSIWLTKPTPEVMLMGMQVLSPTFSVLSDATDPSISVVHPSASRNSGKRSLGFNAGLPSGSMVVAAGLLLIRTEAGDVAPLGAFGEEGVEVFHEGEFGLGAGFPAEFQRGHEVAQLLAIEDHAEEDAVHEALQGGGGQPVLAGDGGQFLGVLFRLEAGVAVADGFFAEAFARFQGGDVGGDVLALVHELGIGLDEADELLAAHLLLARRLLW